MDLYLYTPSVSEAADLLVGLTNLTQCEKISTYSYELLTLIEGIAQTSDLNDWPSLMTEWVTKCTCTVIDYKSTRTLQILACGTGRTLEFKQAFSLHLLATLSTSAKDTSPLAHFRAGWNSKKYCAMAHLVEVARSLLSARRILADRRAAREWTDVLWSLYQRIDDRMASDLAGSKVKDLLLRLKSLIEVVLKPMGG